MLINSILRSRTHPQARTSGAIFVSVCLASGLLLSASAQARDFGGGGFHGFGGGDLGHGGFHFGGDEMAGYRGSHPLFGDDVRPALGGDRPLDRPGDRPINIDNQHNINIQNNFYNRPFNGWHPNWANGGYWNHRPWNAGWYHWGPTNWGWWNANAAAWGIAGLATGVAITELVNNAAAQQSTVIVVPETQYQLNYGSVEAVGTQGASFAYTLSGGATLQGAVNCKQGLLNGQVPQTAANAQLVNAVCQVAFGSAG